MKIRKYRSSSKKMSFAKTLWLWLCLIMTILWSYASWDVKTNPTKYSHLWHADTAQRFWLQSSEQTFLVHLLILTVWFLLGVVLSLWKSPIQKNLLITHCAISVILLTFIAFTQSIQI